MLLSFSSKFLFTVDLCTNPVKVTCSPCAVFHGYSVCSMNGVEVTPELHARLSLFTAEVILYVHHVQYKQITLLARGVTCSPIFSHDTVIIARTLVITNACALSGSVICPVRCG